MSANWKDDKSWSDKFMQKLQMVAGLLITSPAPVADDAFKNTDMIVLVARSVRIACRIRRYEFYKSFPHDFTIRSARDTGTKTELSKILDGWGDYLIYGFSNQAETNLEAWRVINLEAFRQNFKSLPYSTLSNGDGTHFCAFDVRRMPPGIVVMQSRKK